MISEINESTISVESSKSNADSLLTVKEVGERLNVSRQSIVNYRNKGVLKDTMIQGKVYIKESDLNTFIDSETNQS